MKKSRFLIPVIIVILLAVLTWRLSIRKDIDAHLVPIQPIAQPIVSTSSPEVANNSDNANNANNAEVINNPEVVIEAPVAGGLITSPLTVTGQAKGNWFFEASLPVRLLDVSGQAIAAVPGQVSPPGGEWMTDKMVPFKAVLTFTAPTDVISGYLVVAKDNPSGLPQNDASVRIPVRFK